MLVSPSPPGLQVLNELSSKGSLQATNHLLSALPPAVYSPLLSGMKQVQLRHGEILHSPDAPVRYAYFPESALIFMLNDLEDGRSAEAGVIGNRGLLGIPLALRSRAAVHRALVQIPGTAMRMDGDTFITAFERQGSFRRIVLDYTWRSLLVTSQYVACNRIHLLKQRLARLLLTLHDHVGSQEFLMTHDSLSQMLGTARSEVATIAAEFRRAGYIRYTRGSINIVMRKKLESEVCECYLTIARYMKRRFSS